MLVHDVIAATTTAPSFRSSAASMPCTSNGSRPSASRKAPRAPESDTRSWGRFGPARLGSTVDEVEFDVLRVDRLGRVLVVPDALGLRVRLDQFSCAAGRPVKAR